MEIKYVSDKNSYRRMTTRRTFIKNSLLASSSLLLFPSAFHSCALNTDSSPHDKITALAVSLLEKWCQGLYANQTNNPGDAVTDVAYTVRAIKPI